MCNVPLNRISESIMVYPVQKNYGLRNTSKNKKKPRTWNMLDEGSPRVFLGPFHLLAVYAGRDIVE